MTTPELQINDGAHDGRMSGMPDMAQMREIDILSAGFTPDELRERILAAEDFHDQFITHTYCDAHGLHVLRSPEWVGKFIRRNGGIPQAVLAKLGSNLFAKRRPADAQAFLAYVAKCHDSQQPLILRVVFGPVKNVQRYGTYQLADMAEYLTLIQLGRVVESIAAIYPHGVKVQMVPDDKRGSIANQWPAFYSNLYVSSIQRMVQNLQFAPCLTVEEGQAALYEQYQVARYLEVAEAQIRADEEFETRFARACELAQENLFHENELTTEAVADSAMRYLIAHRAEVLSGMWSPIHALPLMFANHPGNFQLFTMGRGMTKLPWQIRLPFAVLTVQERALVPLPMPQLSRVS